MYRESDTSRSQAETEIGQSHLTVWPIDQCDFVIVKPNFSNAIGREYVVVVNLVDNETEWRTESRLFSEKKESCNFSQIFTLRNK